MKGAIKNRIFFLSFADSKMQRSSKRILAQAQSMGVFDEIRVCDERDLHVPELAAWQDKFSRSVRGFGYWSWKPYLIARTLNEMQDGDVLLYCDAGTYLNPVGLPRFEEYLRMLDETPLGILAFDSTQHPECPYLERQWNKGELMQYLDCMNRPEIVDTPQIAATQVLVRRCPASADMLQCWNEIWQSNFHFIDDSPSAVPNASDFRQHRHDQSIFSLLYKLNGGKALPWNEKYASDWRLMEKYPIWSVRDRGDRIRPLLGYLLYRLLAYLPVPKLRRACAGKAVHLYATRPWLWNCPRFLRS